MANVLGSVVLLPHGPHVRKQAAAKVAKVDQAVCRMADLLLQPDAADSHFQQDEWIPIAVVSRPFGIAGAMRCRLLNRDSHSLQQGVYVRLQLPNHTMTAQVQSICAKNCICLQEIQTPQQAKLWQGADVLMRRCELPALLHNELYLSDLINKSAYTPQGEYLGRIVAFADNRAQHLVCLQTEAMQRVQVPFVKPILQGTTAQGDIILNPPIGLLEACRWS
ncbi:MAG: PRC-barrel domain-containing protein [Myxococcota bacterium]